jgi:hypothetical protein
VGVAVEPFRSWRAGIRTLVQGGAWRWALALGFSIALGGGAWAYDVYGSAIHTLWPMWKEEGRLWQRETLLWIEFLASITLTAAILCWFTALFFCVMCALLFGLLALLDRLSSQLVPGRDQSRMRNTIDEIWRRDRLWGSILNVVASLAALATLTKLLDRSLDYWDLGIQIAVSAAIELIVFQVLFAQGRLSWPGGKTS